MKIYPTKIIKLIPTTFVLFLFFSCATDSDLLSDFVLEDAIVNETTIDADNASIVVDEDKAVSFNMLNNAASKGSRRRYKSSKQPKNGGLVIEKDSIAVYTPDYDFNGKDAIEITLEVINDDNTSSDVLMTVGVTVTPTADVVDDKVETDKGSSLLIEPLKNDKFSQESAVVISKTTNPSKGSVVLNDDNTVTYTPNTGAVGIDLFTYTTELTNLDDSITTETGNITVTINGSEESQASAGPMGPLKAFPGAVGHGRNATGGRGGYVYEVTNLNSSGLGSLAYGVETLTGARTIIFKVSGTINHGGGDYLYLGGDNGDVTIAGETAPGGGIAIRGEFRISDSNVIVRNIRIRNDSDWSGSSQAAIRIASYGDNPNISDIIIDHVSMSWAEDENLTITATSSSGSVNNVTIQNCFITDNVGTGKNVIAYWNTSNISFYQNLFGYSSTRNIRSSSCSASWELINNYTYNYTESATIGTFGNIADLIGNHWDTGGNSLPYGNDVFEISAGSADNCSSKGQTSNLSNSFVYFADNLFNGGVASYGPNAKSRLQSTRQNASDITPYSSTLTKTNVLANAGAYNGLPQGLDTFDAARFAKIASGAGGNRMKSAVYPSDFPNIPTGTPYTDSDKDGMSNIWETANGLNPNDARDGKQDRDGDGYTNLEEYLHFLTIQ
ncbi:Ig-like domain-containing protein [Sediminicola arcticus]|uniref:Ig-like domain-containing protein n=1 Tax=Sediminicola arcticus TaxID=1574308 RepID=A0ABV2SV11_9FLAO